MGNKILKITESQLKIIVENSILEAVPAAQGSDTVSTAANGIIKATAGMGTNAKTLINFIKTIPDQSALDKVNVILGQFAVGQGKNEGFQYKDLVAVLNGELEDDNNYAALEIINHAFKQKLNITATPIKVTKYTNVDPNLFYPKSGTWKIGPAFNSATGEVSGSPASPEQNKKVSATPDPKVVEIQNALIKKGYKLPGKNGGADGIAGRWTKIAQDIDKNDPQNGAATFNAKINAARKKSGSSNRNDVSQPNTDLNSLINNPKVSPELKMDLEALRKKLQSIGVNV